MAKKKINYKQEIQNFLYITFASLVILLSMANLSRINDKKEVKVLGIQEENDNLFWQEFLKKHPTYRDGWVEIGRMDMVKKIDPNWSEK